MVKFKRYGDKVEFTCDHSDEARVIKKALTIKHPEAVWIKKRNSNRANWDGLIKFYDPSMNTFPIGMIDMAIAALKEDDIEYKKVNFIKDAFVPSVAFHDTLYQHQKEALSTWFKYRHGILQIPTRGGKTYTAAEAIWLVKNDIPESYCMFIVDTEDLFLQATKDLKDYFKIRGDKNIKIGYVKEGQIDIQTVNVATIQSIQSILAGGKRVKLTKNRTPQQFRELKKERNAMKRLLEDFLSLISFAIVDECHEHCSTDRLNVHKKMCNTMFRMYISATPFKSENELGNLNLMTVSGPIIYRVKESMLKERGVLAKDKILLLNIDHNNNRNIRLTDKSSYRDFEEQIIVNNEQRNNILVNVMEICRKLALKTLVLFQYKKHGNYVQSISGDVFLSGDANVKYRNEVKRTFLRRKGDVLLASNIFKKGVTLPEVQILFNAGGGLEQSLIIQRKGRVLGVKGTKTKALTIDFVDDFDYFNIHSLSRIQVYEESVGLDNITILDVSDNDFYRDVRDFLKEWFEL